MATASKKLTPDTRPGSVQAVSIADAKAHLSSLVARVEKKHTPITIMRRGVPVAKLVSLSEEKPPSLYGSMRGTVQEIGDIIGPTGVEWTLSDSDD